MMGFYVSIMFIGIILILVSIFWIAIDRKKTIDEKDRLDEKREELVRIINDAELMVEELNKFSDYIVSQIDQKNSEACKMIQKAEDIMEKFKHENYINNIDIKFDRAQPDFTHIKENSEIIIESIVSERLQNIKNIKAMSSGKLNEKVISINSKHKEVINLSHKGLNETEIARRLNMGKGEIQLILGVNKG